MSHFIHLREGTVYAREWNPITKPRVEKEPILLFHDSLGCVDVWHDFPQLLCERSGRKVIAYDRLGYGRSDIRLKPLSMDFIKEEVEVSLPTILSWFHLKKFIAFGHSAGGSMALICASKFSDACIGVITEAAAAFVEDKMRQNVMAAGKKFQDGERLKRLKKYHGEKAEWVLNGWVKTWPNPKFSSWNLEADLPLIQCPLLAIQGDLDRFLSIQQVKMICTLAGGPSQMQILQDCGHVPHREKTEAVLNLVLNFLELHFSNRFEHKEVKVISKL